MGHIFTVLQCECVSKWCACPLLGWGPLQGEFHTNCLVRLRRSLHRAAPWTQIRLSRKWTHVLVKFSGARLGVVDV